MINCCFVANFDRTKLYRKIADYLHKNGDIQIFWIVTDEKLHNLCDHDSYLHIDFKTPQNVPIDDFKINELIFSDRMLKRKPVQAENYLLKIQKPIYDYLKDNKISFVFGEFTWAHELLISRICTKRIELHCKYFSFDHVRIPPNRFAFFSDEFQTKIVTFPNKNSNDAFVIDKPESFSVYTDYTENRHKLSNKVKRVINNLCKITSSRMLHPFTNYNPVDCTQWEAVCDYFENNKNYKGYKKLRRKNFDDYKNKNFVFCALHVQPEASIDVYGRYYDNQYENILNIWRRLPLNWFLLIKEHPNKIGGRPLSFFQKILQLPNVILIDENTDTLEIIKSAKLIFSVTGTIALEAALQYKPAILLRDTFFSNLNNIHRIGTDDLSICDFSNYKPSQNLENVTAYKNFIIKNSFPGSLIDVRASNYTLSDINIFNIGEAFLTLIKQEYN